jgi:hypothetical protein
VPRRIISAPAAAPAGLACEAAKSEAVLCRDA